MQGVAVAPVVVTTTEVVEGSLDLDERLMQAIRVEQRVAHGGPGHPLSPDGIDRVEDLNGLPVRGQRLLVSVQHPQRVPEMVGGTGLEPAVRLPPQNRDRLLEPRDCLSRPVQAQQGHGPTVHSCPLLQRVFLGQLVRMLARLDRIRHLPQFAESKAERGVRRVVCRRAPAIPPG
jgi:hypothetical protein